MTMNLDNNLERLPRSKRERIPARLAIVDTGVKQALRTAYAELVARFPADRKSQIYNQIMPYKIIDVEGRLNEDRLTEQPKIEAEIPPAATQPPAEAVSGAAVEPISQQIIDIETARKAVVDALEYEDPVLPDKEAA